jgi:hypothetical protein
MNWFMMWRFLAPMASLMPLGALADHDVHDVGDADAGDEQCEDADESEEDLDAEGDGVAHLLVLDEVPHWERALVLRVELVAGTEHTVELCLDELGSSGVARSEEQMVHVTVAVDAPECGGRDDGAARVGAVVHAVLELLLHDADDRKRQVVEHHGLADRVIATEQLLGDLIAQEENATPLVEVGHVDEATAGGGVHAPHVLEGGVHTLHVSRGLVFPDFQGRAPDTVGGAHQVDLFDRAGDQVEVFFHEADSPAPG